MASQLKDTLAAGAPPVDLKSRQTNVRESAEDPFAFKSTYWQQAEMRRAESSGR